MDPHKTHPSATAEGSEREPAERLALRSCVHLGQARELATFRLGERRGRKRDFRYRRFATIDLEMRRCKLPCARRHGTPSHLSRPSTTAQTQKRTRCHTTPRHTFVPAPVCEVCFVFQHAPWATIRAQTCTHTDKPCQHTHICQHTNISTHTNLLNTHNHICQHTLI